LLITREVFNNIHTWHFESEQDRMEILLFVFEFVHDMLSIPNEVIKEDLSKKLLRDICVYSFLYTDNAASLLRYVAIGNAALQNFMENESNWIAAVDTKLNLLVINTMRILMQLLRLKETVAPSMNELAPLEQMIYTQPKQRDALKIIPIVANYTTYTFNRRFAVLSCRLLRRFAIEFQSSLSACLDLEADQVRMMFLQRLRDDLESEDLKIAILDFVNACIDKQPGLTEAFFKVSYEQGLRSSYFIKRSNDDESCDGIITYMEEFLEAVSKDPSKITNDQLKRIMNLFHALWKQGLQSLVSSLLKKDNFWPSLCSPILTTPISNYQYSQLLNIMGIELFKLRENSKETEHFQKMVEKFLSKEVFHKWLRVVFELPSIRINDSIEEVPEWLGRLQSFKDFLVLLIKKKEIIKIPDECSKMLLDNSLRALVKAAAAMENGNDTRPFIVLAELYLIILNDQNLRFTKNNDEDAQLLENVESLLKSMTICYEGMHKRAKESILAIAIKTLSLESNEIKNYQSTANSFVKYSLEVLCMEFFLLANEMKVDKNETEKGRHSIILAVNLLKKILLIGDDFYGNCAYWFNHYKILNRLLNVVGKTCQDPSKCKITSELLDLLIILAKGSYSKNIIYCDVGDYLWMNLITPKSLSEAGQAGKHEAGWTAQNWWNIYTKGIQLVKFLLEQEGHLFIKEALFFVGIHEQHLSEAISLAKFSLEPNAVKLIKSSLELIAEVVKYESFWTADYQLTVHNLVVSIFKIDNVLAVLY
jgi:nuclear pore complex protein Nup188